VAELTIMQQKLTKAQEQCSTCDTLSSLETENSALQQSLAELTVLYDQMLDQLMRLEFDIEDVNFSRILWQFAKWRREHD